MTNHPLAHWTCPNGHHLLYDYMPHSGPICNVSSCWQLRFKTFTMVDKETHALDNQYQKLSWDRSLEEFCKRADIENEILKVLRDSKAS